MMRRVRIRRQGLIRRLLRTATPRHETPRWAGHQDRPSMRISPHAFAIAALLSVAMLAVATGTPRALGSVRLRHERRIRERHGRLGDAAIDDLRCRRCGYHRATGGHPERSRSHRARRVRILDPPDLLGRFAGRARTISPPGFEPTSRSTEVYRASRREQYALHRPRYRRTITGSLGRGARRDPDHRRQQRRDHDRRHRRPAATSSTSMTCASRAPTRQR